MPILPTVRISELAPLLIDLSLEDRLPVWIASDNRTRYVEVQKILDFMVSGGTNVTHPPVAFGASIIYEVPGVIGSGVTTYNNDSLVGKDFKLYRGGLPLIALAEDGSNASTAEYTILDAGGFRLLNGAELMPFERYELLVFSLIAQGPNSNTVTPASAGIRGKKVITENTSIDPLSDMGKVIQLRVGNNLRTVTLPGVENVAEFSEITFETTINCAKPVRITGTSGQLFYMKNSARTELFMHPGESLRLFRDTDGWYVLNDFYINYKDLGKPVASYRVNPEDNELLCKGQELNRADYPRLWEYINGQPSTVTDAQWLTASVTLGGKAIPRPYRGAFSSGNGETTFRLPDLMNMFLRGSLNDTGTDSTRVFPRPGGFQLNEFLSHSHSIDNGQKWGSDSGGQQGSDDQSDSRITTTGLTGGTETRPDNTSTYWVMRF